MAERDEEQRELTIAIERLNQNLDTVADSTAKTADKIAKTTDELTKVVKSTDKLGKSVLDASYTGLKIAGGAAVLREAHKRGALSKIAKGAFMTGLAGSSLGGGGVAKAGKLATVAKLALSLHPILKIAGVALSALLVFKGAKRLGRGGGGGASGASSFSEQEKQTVILAALLRTSLKNNENLATVYGRARAAQDPFLRTPSFFANNRQSFTPMSNTPTQMQAKAAATLIAAQNESSAASQALSATIALHFQPIQRLGAELDSRFKTNMNFWIQTIGAGKTLLDMALNDAMDFAFGAATQQAGRGGPLGGQPERDLFRLQTRGPGSIIGAPPTAQAGTAGGYAVRVQLQRQSLQTQVTKQWQDDVLKAMKELVALNLLQPDDLYRKRVEFGRPGI